jgi:hypothetical protein
VRDVRQRQALHPGVPQDQRLQAARDDKRAHGPPRTQLRPRTPGPGAGSVRAQSGVGASRFAWGGVRGTCRLRRGVPSTRHTCFASPDWLLLTLSLSLDRCPTSRRRPLEPHHRPREPHRPLPRSSPLTHSLRHHPCSCRRPWVLRRRGCVDRLGCHLLGCHLLGCRLLGCHLLGCRRL